MPLEEATYARTTEISSMIQSLKDKVLEKRKKLVNYFQQSVEVLVQVADVKNQVQANVDIYNTCTYRTAETGCFGCGRCSNEP